MGFINRLGAPPAGEVKAAAIRPAVTAAKVCRACRRQGCDCAEEAARLERESR